MKTARHTIETVIRAHLLAESNLAGVNVYSGDSGDTAELPKVLVICETANPPSQIPQGLGNYACNVRVSVISNADDTTLEQHRSRCLYVSQAMDDIEALRAAFTNDGGAFFYDVTFQSDIEGASERSWANGLQYNVLICLNPLPA